ncbi:MAG: ParB/RepB/Spo0J family partition protein [Deltaproteobacteria bacterium]|nr:ParB/RepB/Spo0J family partition protein [Deltaproteobacteria bacterium]
MSEKGRKGPEKRVLGRGLDALLPVTRHAQEAAQRADVPYRLVGIERVHPRKDQPRRTFEPTSLEHLADSIREQGVIQPLVVRRADTEGDYELIAGERRWRAAQQAGLREVPVVLREATPDEAFELALVENLQRQDLDPIETAMAYQRLVDEHGHTQDEVARRVGKDRSTVTNTLRMLNLPRPVQEMLVSRALSEGHARALLSLEDPEAILKVAKQAAEKGWTVRKTEEYSRARKDKSPKGDKAPPPEDAPATPTERPPRSANVRDLEARLAAALGMHVVVRTDAGGTSGSVEFGYDNLDQLDGLLAKILGS